MSPDDEQPEFALPPPDGLLTPLHVCVLSEDVDELRRRQAELMPLLESKDRLGQTPLHWAVFLCHWSMVKLLLELGADVLAVDSELETPLHGAAKKYAATIAAILLDYGADSWAVDSNGALPVHYAADEGGREILTALHAERLLTAPDGHGSYPIHRAASRDNIAGVLWFLEHGADVDFRDRDGNPILFHAIVSKAEKVVSLLNERGADWSLRGESGMTALEYLRQAWPGHPFPELQE